MRTNRPLASSLTMWSILLFLGSILMGVGVFAVTQAAKQHESGIEEINKSIMAERQSIRVLEAEWAYLSRPQRLEELMAVRATGSDVPPASVQIAAAPEEKPAAQAKTAPVTAEEKIEPAAGTKESAAPIKTVEVKKEEPAIVRAGKTTQKPAKMAQSSVAKTPVKRADYNGAWSPVKKKIVRTNVYHPAPAYQNIASHGGMRPIVE